VPKDKENLLNKLDEDLDSRLKSEPDLLLKSSLLAIKWHSCLMNDKEMLNNLNYISKSENEQKLLLTMLSFMQDIDKASNLLDYAEKGHLDLIGEAFNKKRQ